MKKGVKIIAVLLILALIGSIGFRVWSATIVKSAMALEDTPLDVSNVEDGIYEGHSELGPVIVDVKVTVESGKITEADILKHENGLGESANTIVDKMVEQNTYDVDIVSGATVSSEVIMNAVNDALQKGLQ